MARPWTTAALAAFALASTVAQGANWQLVQAGSGARTSLDVESVTAKDGDAIAWTEQAHAAKVPEETGAFYFRSTKAQVRFGCATGTVTVLVRGWFDDQGSEIRSSRKPEAARTAFPDSAEDRMLKLACALAAAPTASQGKAVRIPQSGGEARQARGTVPQQRFMDGPPAKPLSNAEVMKIATKTDAHAESKAKPAEAKAAAPKEAAREPEAKKEAPAKAAEAPAKEAQKEAAKESPKAADAPARDAVKPAEAPAKAAPRVVEAPRVKPAPASVHNPVDHPRKVATAHEGPRPYPGRAAAAAHGKETAHHEAHWSYEGEHGPWRWGDMKSDFSLCKAGSRQSPVDIRNAVVAELEPVEFRYQPAALKVVNNGHTIQVEYADGSYILHAGRRYDLVQFHFHTPSEERINGRQYEMVAHLVHRSARGELAVVAVMLTAGQGHPVIQSIWDHMPGAAGKTVEPADVTISVADLLPAERSYYSFMGSLTTPPCSEGVNWIVLRTPVEISRNQLAHFAALYPMNARPLQALNDRLIKAGR